MNTRKLFCLVLTGLVILAAGCGQEDRLSSPEDSRFSTLADKNGTETLGAPDIPISIGSGFAEGGVGMVGVASGGFTVEVPAGAAIQQVLLYWAGGTTGAPGDDTIDLNGTAVQGTLIGGPVPFFTVDGVEYSFSAYRADITNLGLVAAGANSFTVSGFDFDTTGGNLDENNGCSLVVITDDGTAAELNLRDGLDMAYFGFQPTLDATVPQTFAVTPADFDRDADLLLLAASVGEERPNRVLVTTSQGDQVFDNALGSNDGLTWDSLILSVLIPAGDDAVTVQLISTNSVEPQGASLGWVGAGLAVALPPEPTEDISGTVFVDADNNGVQGLYESGIGNVVLDIDDGQGNVATVVTAADGTYVFSGPAGSYTVTLSLTDHLTAFNEDLAASFTPTTPLSVSVSGATAGVDFGFVPDVEAILADLDFGELTTDARPLEYWTKVFRRALIEQNSGRRALGHHDGDPGGGGWGLGEDYFNGDDLRALLAVIATLYQPEPYLFTPGSELEEVYTVLKTRPLTDEQDLFRELLVTELNFAAGTGLVDEVDRLGVLISWGESLLVTASSANSANKGSSGDIAGAITIFGALNNTGGGGGVDE